MIHPQNIETTKEKASYMVPRFQVSGEGILDAEPVEIKFCKGNKADPEAFRQAGFFTETLLATCLKYLQENNVGELSSRETSIAITKIEEALLWLGKRSADRQARGVQGTYQK